MNIKKYYVFLLILGFSIQAKQASAQEFSSLVGARIGYKTLGFSAKIALDSKNYLEGTVGIVTPQPDYTVGAGAAYHRHIMLNNKNTCQFYFGTSLKAVIGDESGFGFGGDLGLTYFYKRINIGVETSPTYFFNDVLEFQPLFGVHLRIVNY